jgi:hypothetical protein
MLKIKDDVDLKELEKFGFRNTDYKDTWYIDTKNDDTRYETGIIVNPTNKTINNQIVYYTNNIEDLEDIEQDYIDLTGDLDIIYDLIQANLIEKVEEK